MEVSGAGKPSNSLSFRYNANNEELEELFSLPDDDPPTPRLETSQSSVVQSENASPKKLDKTSSIIDKYFKSMRTEKNVDKQDEKSSEGKSSDDAKISAPKEATSSPMKEYLNKLGKRNSTTAEATSDVKESSNETWRIFHDFKFKIAQAVEDIKTRSGEEVKEKSIPRENSISDSEENSVIKDSDQQSVGDTDNQVSSLDSSIQNLSDVTQPVTAKPTDKDLSLPADKNHSESSDDTHKNFAHSDSIEGGKDIFDDSHMMDVESGIEALEDSNIENIGNIVHFDTIDLVSKVDEGKPVISAPQVTNCGTPPNKNNIDDPEKQTTKKTQILSFYFYFLTFLVFLNYILFPKSNIWNGFLLGIWFFWMASSFKQWFLDTYLGEWEPVSNSFFQLKRTNTAPPTYTIPSVKEHRPLKKYEGWINHYRFPDYDPYTYHVNKSTTAFIKVEGCNLRISYTKTKIAKRALWNEKIEKIEFYQHRLYNLTGARVILLPKGLVRKRQWSKKYPICIILNDKEKIQVLEKENIVTEKKIGDDKKKSETSQTHAEMENSETNTSPEKKRKFVWRRREKSLTRSDAESCKEGLRHRFARKMHREKKTDSSATVQERTESPTPTEKTLQLEEQLFHDAETDLSNSTNKDDVAEVEIDETDISRIKEFLEEAETEAGAEGTSEGEWSVHIKQSSDRNSHLYLFGRTGRDKHEWYRRFMNAINEANAASTESSTTEEKPASEQGQDSKEKKLDGKDSIEMAVYKLSEKETVSFAKSTKLSEADAVVGAPSSPIPYLVDVDMYEKTFWPYLIKIIQSKHHADSCDCRMLPSEVTWLNTVMARIMYDVMRDPNIIRKLQNKIQKKLNTLKLPSFMSPLVVTALSLQGACPLVEHVSAPACDERGVWLDADMRYDGGATITILTQLNLMKLKEKNLSPEDQLFTVADNIIESEPSPLLNEPQLRKRKPAIYDSEVEDSAESSSDDETPPMQPVDSEDDMPLTEASPTTPEGTSSKKKFLRIVDKIATNKYFQQVTDYKYVKRAMEGLSNTDIKLQVEVQALEGRLALNLPPPPHDRLWLGFRTNPQLVLRARPAVGARALRFAQVTNWIEQKLTKEFEKVLVLPNMEDFQLDLLTPTPVEFE